jgi:peptide/nickel transport system permease protein
MASYIVRRLFLAVVVLLIVTLLLFITVHLLPGDPIYMLMTSGQASDTSMEELNKIRHEYGLDKPLAVQYVDWLGNVAFHANLGVSLVQHVSVIQLIRERVPVSLYLGGLAFVIGIPIGIIAGVLCAVRRNTALDTVVTSFANIGVCIPSFWLAILLIYAIGLQLHLLPVFGFTSPFSDLGMSIKQVIMPVFCLAIAPIAMNCRLTRSSMLEVIHQDYIRTAWSKGLRERVIILRHALKNGIIPVLTMLGMGIGNIIGGSIFVERVFGISGMGKLTVDAAFAHDYPVLQGAVLLFASIVLASNLIVDLCYGWIDPRVRYE